jgi:8-oxo-dGTP diphosphatase
MAAELYAEKIFGTPAPGLVPVPRPAAFVIAKRDGRIAVVRIVQPERTYWDLPGGGIEAGETPEQTAIREAQEEAGLIVRLTGTVGCVGQHLRSKGKAYLNQATIFEAEVEEERPSLKVEDNHTLYWLEPSEALTCLRHEGYAYSVMCWMRAQGDGK